MKEKLGTIFGLFLFVFIFSGMVYLNFFNPEEKKEVYSEIKLEGNLILSTEDYLTHTKLNNNDEYPDLTLQEIKSRVIKHPYILKAEVQTDGTDKVIIKVFEKYFMAVILAKNNPYLVTDNFELIRLEENSDISGFPVISNVSLTETNVSGKSVKSLALLSAFKIIEATKIVSDKIYKDLTEINLRFGGDVILTFSGIKCPVIFGKGLEGKKMVILFSIWQGLHEEDELFKNSSYV